MIEKQLRNLILLISSSTSFRLEAVLSEFISDFLKVNNFIINHSLEDEELAHGDQKFGGKEKAKVNFNSGSNTMKLRSHLREEIQTRIREIGDNPQAVVDLNEHIRDLKKRRRERITGRQAINYVSANMSQLQNWNMLEEHKSFARSNDFEKIKVYAKKRY